MSDIRWLILNSKEPLVFKDFLNWEILKWDLDQWSKVIGDEEMTFRCGKFENTVEPQWERSTKTVKGNFGDFQTYQENNSNEWIYFDYKYLAECFLTQSKLQESISWEAFGFTELKWKESTIWIGSKGAHTPCHIDTYGCNLIAQIYGRKRWIVFSPEENLYPTRIPYEESSIYSKLNVFCPDTDKFKGISKCKSFVLNPGEVLLLPHGWWHYVENLDKAISINAWIPLPTDNGKRLEESLVQLLISQIVKDLSPAERNVILNPNADDLIKQRFSETIRIISTCKERCKTNARKKIKLDTFQNKQNFSIDGILENYRAKINNIPYLLQDEFIKLLEEQKNRFQENIVGTVEDTNIVNKTVIDVINAFTDQDVIHLVKTKLNK